MIAAERRPETQRSARGFALIVVLILTAMITVLVVAVIDTGIASTKHSVLMASNLEVEALEELPAQIIVSQLQRATTRSVTNDGERLTWTSQPGMIRVFGTQVPAGQVRPRPRMHYRLYSAPMMNTPTLDTGNEAAAFSDWDTQPAGFTDLNEPVIAPSHQGLVFPIADARALGRVDGFASRATIPGASATHPLPMPVAWIYVLRDGKLVMPSILDGKIARFPPNVATKENPISGRIAFWTDDESCKLNLNTATEAAAWDMPAANTRVERDYAAHVPVSAELNRLSGHPAFTSLSPVLKTFGSASKNSPQWPKPDALFPSLNDASSEWRRYQDCYQSLVPHGVGANLTVRHDRHFATVDEFYFDPQRQRNGASAGFLMEEDDLNMARFFLTTHSAAPELNPFGGPKIALWMVPKDPGQRSITDRRVALATSLNADTPQRHEFVFQRFANWSSPTKPGSSQSMTDDWSQVPRNQELYAWLQKLCSLPIPGFGGRFIDKYGARSRDQILTSMLDMLRWSANTDAYLPPSLGEKNPQGLAEQSTVPLTIDSPAGGTRGFGRFPTVTEVAVVFAFTDVERKPDGSPRDDDHDGICDRATKLRAFLVVNPFLPACGAPGASPAWSVRIRRLQHFTIGQGIGLALPGGNVRNRCTLSGSKRLGTGVAWGGNTSGYACFASQFIQADGSPKQIGKRDDPGRDFPFISNNDVGLQGDTGRPGTTIRFSGGAIVVDLMDPNAPLTSPQPNDSIHSVEMEFPDLPIPMPSLPVSDFATGPRQVDNRFQPVMIGGEMRLPLIQRGDVVRSMVLNPNGPSRGDARVVAARRELFLPEAANWFVPHPDYTSMSATSAQSLRDGVYMTTGQYGAPVPQPTDQVAGTLLPGKTYAANAIPAVPLGLNGAKQPAIGSDPGGRLGDWESGSGLLEDGPFVHRTRLGPEASFTRGSITSANAASNAEPLSQFPCAISFGAIPSGIYGDSTDPTPRPWQTLLFCPNPAGRSSPASQSGRYDSTARDHFGFGSPPDHLWLEFFTMPVLEPWPMTSGLATEGKVNLNHQLMPFTWLQRATALCGVFKGVRLTAIPTAALIGRGDSAKGHADGSPLDATFRYEIDADKTVLGLSRRFDSGDVFRSTSEICEQLLVPKRIEGQTYDGDGFSPRDPANFQHGDMIEWWNGNAADPSDAFEATGDNLREAPYLQLYPRLCTQSNVFRIHYCVQLLQKARSTSPEEWDEARDHITASRRGSRVVERSLGKQTVPLSDPATNNDVPSLHDAHTFRLRPPTHFGP